MVNHPDPPSEPEDATRMLPDDATRAVPEDATRAVPEDATRAVPEDATRAVPEDATSRLPQAPPAEDRTAVIDPTARTVAGGQPPVAPDATLVGPAAPRWSARANVPPPGSLPTRPAVPEEGWPEEDPYAGRSWFTPVIVGIVLLVLAAALAVGIWLIYRAVVERQGKEPLPPMASSSASASALPSSAKPSPSPSMESTAPSPTPSIAEVAVPALRGDTVAEATGKLTALGLKVRVKEMPDGSLPPGQVLDTMPAAGSTVAVGETVTLIVATAPESPTSPSPVASDRGD